MNGRYRMRNSNQRITKIKRDPIEELLKKAEAKDVATAVVVQEPGMDLTPYPDMDNLRLWTRDNLLSGVDAIYNVDLDADGQTYMTTIVDGLPLFTKLSKAITVAPGYIDFEQPVLTANGTTGSASFAVEADSELAPPVDLYSGLLTIGTPSISPEGIASNFSETNYFQIDNPLKGNSTWIVEFTTPNTWSEEKFAIIHLEGVLSLEIVRAGSYRNLSCWNYRANEPNNIITSLNTNTTYRVKVHITTDKRRQFSIWNGSSWGDTKIISDTGINWTAGYPLRIGLSSYDDGSPFTGGLVNLGVSGFGSGDIDEPTTYFATVRFNAAAFNATNNEVGYWQSNSDATEHYLTYYNPSPIKLKSVVFSNKLCTDNQYIPEQLLIQGSNSNSQNDWTTLGTFINTNNAVGIDEEYEFTVDSELAFKYFRVYIIKPLSSIQIGYMKLVGLTQSGEVLGYTSKPGLWLSNLCSPQSGTPSGSWLRSNLINYNHSGVQQINSDIIGNYTFSYFQRGIIHRDAGSTHDNNDSYCQHWSPSALGCISHDSLIIPTNNLRNTYTSYQTLAVPTDVNRQQYGETPSKDVNFTFVDNNNNIPLSTTTFNGRVVGEGWTYEFIFEPNYGGSGNNYGVTMDDVPNGSNGGCVKGSITYILDNGDICTQQIDKCFVTTQALFNDYNTQTGEPLEGKENAIIKKSWSGRCGKAVIIMPEGPYQIVGVSSNISNFGGTKGTLYLGYSGAETFSAACSTNGCTVFVKGNKELALTHGSYVTVSNGHACSRFGGDATIYTVQAIEPESNVTIYLNIWDLQKEYAAQGLPWAYTCDYDRFRISISTQPCSDWFCTSYVIAENVNINDLGDISILQRKVFSGG